MTVGFQSTGSTVVRRVEDGRRCHTRVLKLEYVALDIEHPPHVALVVTLESLKVAAQVLQLLPLSNLLIFQIVKLIVKIRKIISMAGSLTQLIIITPTIETFIHFHPRPSPLTYPLPPPHNWASLQLIVLSSAGEMVYVYISEHSLLQPNKRQRQVMRTP